MGWVKVCFKCTFPRIFAPLKKNSKKSNFPNTFAVWKGKEGKEEEGKGRRIWRLSPRHSSRIIRSNSIRFTKRIDQRIRFKKSKESTIQCLRFVLTETNCRVQRGEIESEFFPPKKTIRLKFVIFRSLSGFPTYG